MIRLWCRCAATGTELKLEFLPYERLCYDGVLEESVKGAALPLPEDCIAPTGCALDQASQDNLGYPSHMQVALPLVSSRCLGSAQAHGFNVHKMAPRTSRVTPKIYRHDRMMVQCPHRSQDMTRGPGKIWRRFRVSCASRSCTTNAFGKRLHRKEMRDLQSGI